ncbi:MAG: hypothetical protein KGN76_02165 [Acidobacteriota bacterium]|nr:hypothetical protein [Acidobacteriota bacterium]
MRKLSVLTLLFGLWLFWAPSVLGYGSLLGGPGTDPAVPENAVLAMLIFGFSVLALLNAPVPKVIDWFMLAFGIWVMFDPMLYHAWHFSRTATINDLLAGGAVVLVSLFQLFAVTRTPA